MGKDFKPSTRPHTLSTEVNQAEFIRAFACAKARNLTLAAWLRELIKKETAQ